MADNRSTADNGMESQAASSERCPVVDAAPVVRLDAPASS
jgi:hypothetical protein